MSVTTAVGLDFMVNSITGQADLQRVIQQATGSGAAKGLGGAIEDTQKQIEAKYGRAYTNALKIGAKQEADQLEKHFKDRQKKIEAETALLMQAHKKVEQYKDRADSNRTKKHWQKRQKELEASLRTEQAAQEKLIDQREASQERMVDLMDRGMQQAADNLETRTEKIGKGFGATIEGIMASGGSIDPSQMLKSAGGGLKEAGPALMAKGGKMAGSSNKMVAMLGKGAMALGAAAGAIAGVVAGLAAVVAVFGMAYGRAKDMNKALLESGSAMDIVGGNSTSLGDGLASLRTASQNVATSLRVTTDEVVKMLGSFNEVGLTFREMRSYVNWAHDDLTAYTAVAQQAIKASTAFGVQGQEIASFTNMLFRDMGQNFMGVQEALGGIFGSAQLANMSMRGFFTSINEATSAMALMNFRMEDTAELLIAMTDILGEDMAKEMSKFKGKFRDMGHVDRMGSVIKAGSGGRKVVGAMAERQTDNFLGSLKTAVGGGKASDALKELGLLKGGKLDLGGLKGAELGRIQEIVARAAGEGGEAIAIRLAKLARVQRGSRKGASLGQQATALGQADDLGELAYGFVEASAILGEKTVGEMENMDRATYEAVTGRSGGELEAMMDISNRMAARMARDKGVDVGTITASDIGVAIAKGDMHLSAADKEMLKVARDKALPEMEKISRAQLIETTSISQTLKNKIGGLLEKTYSVLTWWSGESEDIDTTNIDITQKVLRGAEKREEKAQKAYTDLNMSDLKGDAEEFLQKRRKLRGEDPLEGKDLEKKVVERANMQAVKIAKEKIKAENNLAESRGAYGAALGGQDPEIAAAEIRAQRLVDTGVIDKEDKKSQVEGFEKNVFVQKFAADMMLKGGKEIQQYADMPEMANMPDLNLFETAFMDIFGLGTGMFLPDIDEEEKDALDAMARNLLGLEETTKKGEDAVEGAVGDAEKGIVEAVKQGPKASRVAHLTAAGATEGKLGSMRYLQGLDTTEWTPEQKHALQVQMSNVKRGVDDFVYQGGSRGGTITPINKADQFLGMKPGGAISQAMGGGVVNNFYINGNNPTQIVSVVRRAVKAALGK